MGKVVITSLLLVCFSASLIHCQFDQEKKVYVVYMGAKHRNVMGGRGTVSQDSMIDKVLGSKTGARDSLIHSFGRSFNGFVAKLSDEEVHKISETEEVVSVLPNIELNLHTTRSWDFLGFTKSYNESSTKGHHDIIIGMFDTGIWPESDSFNDEGFGPPPKKWKGSCQTSKSFTCNNKIIGARVYDINIDSNATDQRGSTKSPRDSIGHGTHTASIAGGLEVEGASYYGLAKGVARGGYPNARIAVYKVCGEYGCSTANILAAFDDAIADGVDIISVSLGSSLQTEYFEDPIAIGSFHAMKNGILTSSSAGNEGPFRATVSNYSPWLLTVAASSIDRKFISPLVLGNGQTIPGMAMNTFNLSGMASFPLIWGGDAANYSANANSLSAKYCDSSALDSEKVKGKIVLCESAGDGSSIVQAGGVGVIMPPSFGDSGVRPYPLPATTVEEDTIANVFKYIRSSKNPKATIQFSETWKDFMAPMVAPFSARGPSTVTPDILKPDITAPGVGILAAWSPIAPTDLSGSTKSIKYHILSGTSMSCPHVSGAAAFVKAKHPHWSPSALKSALMTTASIIEPTEIHKEDKEFAYGSGLLNPAKAIDPGLVFDISGGDYIDFLCKQGYNTSRLRLITGDHSYCKNNRHGRAWDLNYPSFSLAIEDGQKINGLFNRTVTNVGSPNSTYQANISMEEPARVKVEPSVLSFSKFGERKSFTVAITGPGISQVPIISGSIIWKDEDGVHLVRTPIVIYTVLPSTLSKKPSHEEGPNLSGAKFASSSMEGTKTEGL